MEDDASQRKRPCVGGPRLVIIGNVASVSSAAARA